jgi:glutamate synthase (NADPH) small chain
VIKPKRIVMRQQKPYVRIHNFDEVPLGYSEDEAVEEAVRCLQCQYPTCIDGCPVNVDIPRFIGHVANRRFAEAIDTIHETNNLPAVCGRVCPQESQCQGVCAMGKKFEAVSIGRLERFCADWEMAHSEAHHHDVPPSNGRSVAVIGSGPAGLTAAADLRKGGYEVTIFELLHVAGGVLMYGIPEFRLPKAIVQREVDGLRALGVKIELNQVVGRVFTIDDLLARGFDAAFVGTGAGLPRFLAIPGEHLGGVFSANEYLTRTNLMRAFQFPESDTPIHVGDRVVTIGGGNVAMDAARTALRLGAKESIVVYRRSVEELPARAEEVEHASDEGIFFQLLANPIRFYGEGDRLTGVECIEMKLGEPDESGRRRPIAIEGTEFVIKTDTVVIAAGNEAHPLIPQTTPDIEVDRWGHIMTDDAGLTSKSRVYAGGDIVTGAATVIEAMGAGKRAAAAIHSYLMDGVSV